MAHAGGRPTLYNEELSLRICELISTHCMGLERICEKYKDLPCAETIRLWCIKYPKFFGQYIEAKTMQSHVMLDSMIDIASDNKDDTLLKVNRDKLNIDTLKFALVKINPKQFDRNGDKEKQEEGSLMLKIIDRLTPTT